MTGFAKADHFVVMRFVQYRPKALPRSRSWDFAIRYSMVLLLCTLVRSVATHREKHTSTAMLPCHACTIHFTCPIFPTFLPPSSFPPSLPPSIPPSLTLLAPYSLYNYISYSLTSQRGRLTRLTGSRPSVPQLPPPHATCNHDYQLSLLVH